MEKLKHNEEIDNEFLAKVIELNSDDEIKKLAKEYRKVAIQKRAYFLDASTVAKPSVTDREHLDEIGHKALSQAVYQIVKQWEKENVLKEERAV